MSFFRGHLLTTYSTPNCDRTDRWLLSAVSAAEEKWPAKFLSSPLIIEG